MYTDRSTDEMALVRSWLSGHDTGASSITLVRFLSEPDYIEKGGKAAYPYDPDDLGRCIRALDLMPFLRDRFKRVGTLGLEWVGYYSHWDKLVALYHEEKPTGSAPKCYAAMQMIRTAASEGYVTSVAEIDDAIAERLIYEASHPRKPVAETVPYIISDAERESMNGKSITFVTDVMAALVREYGRPCAKCKKKRAVYMSGQLGPTPNPDLCDPCARA